MHYKPRAGPALETEPGAPFLRKGFSPMKKSKPVRWSAKAIEEKLRNAPLIVLTAVVSLTLEVFGWAYIHLTNHAHAEILGLSIPMATVEGVIITASGLLALVAAFVAAERRADPRPEIRATAWRAQVLAIVLLAGPTFKAADGFAFPQQQDAAHAFAVSDEAKSYREIVADPASDSQVKADAAAQLARGTPQPRAVMDGTWAMSFVFAAFLYGANMSAAAFLWRVKPETATQRERRIENEDRRRADRDRRMAEEREHEMELARLKAMGKRPSWFGGMLSGERQEA